MQLEYHSGIYVFYCDYEQRHWPRSAGFKWHRSPCSASPCPVCDQNLNDKFWWTDKPNVAIRLKEHATQDCKRHLKKYEKEVSEAVKESRAEDADIDVPAPDGLEYRGFQKAGIAYALKREATIIADEMGLGKCQIPCDEGLMSVDGVLARVDDHCERLKDAETEEYDGEGYWYEVVSPCFVDSIDANGQIRRGKIKRIYKQWVSEPVRRIKLDDGSELVCTKQHQLKTVDGWTRELSVGDRICVPARLTAPRSSLSPLSQDKDLAYVLAWQIGEGLELKSCNRIDISQADPTILHELKSKLRRLEERYGYTLNSMPIKNVSGDRTASHLLIHSVQYVTWLESHGYSFGNRSASKRIPDFITQAPDRVIRVFLQAFFDAEACVNEGNIEISSASSVLMQQLSYMLRRLGIWMRRSSKTKHATNSPNPQRRLYHFGLIGGSDARRFKEVVGFNVAQKQRKLQLLCKKTCNDNCTGIPVRGKLREIREISGLPYRHLGFGSVYCNGSQDPSPKYLKEITASLLAICDGSAETHYRKLPPSKWTEQTLLAYRTLDKRWLKAQCDQLVRLVGQEVNYAKISEIKEYHYEGWVYDFEIETHHNYVAGGLLSHNTVQGLGVVNTLDPDQHHKILIICPASLRLNWEREAKKWLLHHNRIFVVEKDLPEDDSSWDVLILNYDKFAGQRRPEFTDFCAKRSWAVVILDEAHYLKNPKAQRTEAILASRSRKRGPKGAIGRAGKKLFLTGTPILNRPVELWPILKTVAKNEFNNFDWFARRYCGRHWNGYAWDVTGSSNLDELQEKLRSTCMIRRLKKDVLKELPPKIRQIIPIPPKGKLSKLLKQEKEAYKKVEGKLKGLEKKVQAAFDKAATKSKKNGDGAKLAAYADTQYREAVNNLRRQMANFEELSRVRHDIAVAKLPFVIEQIDSALAETDKVVVFAHHRDVCEAIRDHFGKKAVILYGGMSDHDADSAVQRFQNDSKIKVFVGSIGAAGVGHTLTESNTVIFAELDWVPANMMQAEDRCIFEGQLVQTEKGPLPIEAVKVGDRVLTHKGRWKRVTAVSSRQHRDLKTEIRYTRFNLPLRTTHDHRILAIKDGENTPAWHQAHTLLPRDYVLLPRPALPEEGLRHIEMPIDVGHDPRQISNYGGKVYRNGKYKQCPRKVAVDDDLLFAIGWYLAEGCACVADNKGSFISFSVHDDEQPVLDRLINYFNSWGLNSSVYVSKNSKGRELRVYSIELANWFKLWFGADCYSKQIPLRVFEALSVTQAQKLCRSYIDGDGYRRNTTSNSTSHEWISVSPTLSYQIALLMSACGEKPCMRLVSGEKRSNYPSQKNRKQADEWIGSYTENGNADNKRLNFSTKEFVCCPISSVETSISCRVNNQYERVYDLTVEEDHSFVVGHAAVHNCHRMGQTDVVNVLYLVLDGSLDAQMASTLIAKQEDIETALDKKTDAEIQAEKSALDVMEREEPEKAQSGEFDVFGLEVEDSDEESTQVHSAIFKAARMKGWDSEVRPSEEYHSRIEVNEKDREFTREAMLILADEKQGFNRYDKHVGQLLASLPEFNDRQVDIARNLAQKYQYLLPSRVLEGLGIRVVGQRNLF